MKQCKPMVIVIAVILALSLFAFAACGNSGNTGSTGSTGTTSAPPANSGGSAPATTAPPPSDEVFTLSWVSFRPENHSNVQTIKTEIFEKLAERTNGRIIVEWKGGPEVVNPSDIGIGIQNGAFDISDNYVGAYESVVPGVGGASLTQYTPQEERLNGAYEFLANLHEPNGVKYLGRPAAQKDNFFYTWLKSKKPMTQAEISALSIGTAAGSQNAVTAWGVTPTMVGVPENYEALNSGIVDAIAGQPLEGAISNGYNVLCDYVIDHPYYQSTVMIIMNLDKWNSLPQDLQEIFMEVMIEGENTAMETRDASELVSRKTVEEGGTEFYKLPDDVADWYLSRAYDGAWEAHEANFPTIAPELRKMLTK